MLLFSQGVLFCFWFFVSSWPEPQGVFLFPDFCLVGSWGGEFGLVGFRVVFVSSQVSSRLCLLTFSIEHAESQPS